MKKKDQDELIKTVQPISDLTPTIWKLAPKESVNLWFIISSMETVNYLFLRIITMLINKFYLVEPIPLGIS